MNLHLGSTKRTREAQLQLFRTRLIARLCIALTCISQFIGRVATINGIIHDNTNSGKFAISSLPFAPVVTLIVTIEYLLFKKKGPRILRYSHIVDLILLVFFMGDWIIGLFSALVHTHGQNPPLFSVSAFYGMTAFAWRAMLVTLIVQKWQLKIIAPVVAIAVTTFYAIHYDPKHFYNYLIKCVLQLFNIVFIIYCEDKIKWRMIWTNLQQEKWMQVNNFILNNIPENIMILDIAGEVKFVSEYCKTFMEKCQASLNTKEFFTKIKDLHQQQFELPSSSPPIQIERLTTENEFFPKAISLRIHDLTDLITNFRNIAKEKNLEERQFLMYNGKLKTKDQQQDKSIEVKISFIQHFENDYIILILRDTTQRDLLLTLQETNKYKDQLLASVSHELRAPLNGNINLVESALNSSEIPELLKENLLTPALRSSKFLLHLINDILDMSQIKEKKLRLVYQTEDIKETLKSTAQLVELQAKKKGVDLVLDLNSKNLPTRFSTDHVRLSQIVLNLLHNAIKFTKEGVIKLSATSIDSEASQVKISIQDSGIGMNQESVQKLFSNYTHIEFEGRQTMNPTGVGLGLNIASNLVELLAPQTHPNINVLSTPNQGSIFSFILENKEKIPTQEIAYEIPDELSGDIKSKLYPKLQTLGTSLSLKGKSLSEPLLESCSCSKILIVDDNPFNTMAFETILNSLEIKCDSVYSGSSAIEILLDRESKKCGRDCKQYSVIFMDQEMPEMNGIETVKEIRRLQEEDLLSKEMRVIGCTAHKSKEEVERFVEAGLDQCIHKPISVAMIKDLL